MADQLFATRTAVSTVYIIGLTTLTGVGIWDVTNIIYDYTTDNRITTVKTINISDHFPLLLNNVKVCFSYPGEAIYPQRLSWDNIYPILNSGWRAMQKYSNTSGNAGSWWETVLQEAVPHFYMYYLISDIDRNGLELDFDDFRRPFHNQKFVNSTGIHMTELYSIIDSYIRRPEKLLQIKKSLDILQFYMGGVLLQTYKEYTGVITSASIAEEGCFWLQHTKMLSTKNAVVRYAYILTTDDMKPYLPSITFTFPETITVWLRSNFKVKIVISNTAVTDSTNFPPCTLECETEEECLEDAAVKIIVDICECAPLTRIARGSIDLSSQKYFCTTEIYKKCWKKAMEEVSRQQDKIKKDKTCKPCINPKNSYSVMTTEQAEKIYMEPTGPLQNVTNFTEAVRQNVTLWPSPQAIINI